MGQEFPKKNQWAMGCSPQTIEFKKKKSMGVLPHNYRKKTKSVQVQPQKSGQLKLGLLSQKKCGPCYASKFFVIFLKKKESASLSKTQAHGVVIGPYFFLTKFLKKKKTN